MLATETNTRLTSTYKKDLMLNLRLEHVTVKAKLRVYEFVPNEAINTKIL